MPASVTDAGFFVFYGKVSVSGKKKDTGHLFSPYLCNDKLDNVYLKIREE